MHRKKANEIRKKNAARNFFFDLNERRNDGMNKVIVVLGLNQSRIFGYIRIRIHALCVCVARVYLLCFTVLCATISNLVRNCNRVFSFNYFVLPFTKSFATAGFFCLMLFSRFPFLLLLVALGNWQTFDCRKCFSFNSNRYIKTIGANSP